jgi:hypothetical protein
MKLPWKPFPPARADERLQRHFLEKEKGLRLPRYHLHLTRTKKGAFYYLTETLYRPVY